MYINRIILRDVRSIKNLDIHLQNDWTQQPLKSVLLTGPNGSGKTTILRAIAALWEDFGILANSQNPSSVRRSFIFPKTIGLIAIEIRDLQSFPIWLFIASTADYHQQLKQVVNDDSAQFVGTVRHRPTIEPQGDNWLENINNKKTRLELGADSSEKLPNLVFLEAESRAFLSSLSANIPIRPESLYQWLVTYDGQDRTYGHLETMLRNFKIRDSELFYQTLAQINRFFGGEKRITDFDDNLRLQVQIGDDKHKTHPIDDLSTGERQCLILMFMVSRWLMEGGIVLIDEPDLHLHVSLQRQFIHELERVVEAKKGQLIVTSHSPTLWEEYHERQRIELGQLTYE